MKSFYLPRFQERGSLKIEFLFWFPLSSNIFIFYGDRLKKFSEPIQNKCMDSKWNFLSNPKHFQKTGENF
ncbi:hypothetical protein B1J93_04300 [Leptospira kirschneri serovar Pomona]|uniref:Uncharacterized protein n=1 Tax=Leptospira kirschneri serovar Pomona TaxID=561005 RepID=A0A1T1DZW3_9LEPT|nr:hypothetical protein AYB32_16090 [Leptospira kirschneri]OOV46203.1 hypothetical protein B1J93_04300 [Leptospira kirschneri serovar Pomona]